MLMMNPTAHPSSPSASDLAPDDLEERRLLRRLFARHDKGSRGHLLAHEVASLRRSLGAGAFMLQLDEQEQPTFDRFLEASARATVARVRSASASASVDWVVARALALIFSPHAPPKIARDDAVAPPPPSAVPKHGPGGRHSNDTAPLCNKPSDCQLSHSHAIGSGLLRAR